MWAVGWRKCMDAFKLAGMYVCQENVQQAKDDYDTLMRSSSKPSAILDKIFHKVANIAFNNNRELMAAHSVPAFCSLHYQEQLGKFGCLPNVTFTTSGFYNPPHEDEGDAQEFAFLLFLPVNTTDGSLIQPTNNYHVHGGAFVFPDYHFGINFSQHTEHLVLRQSTWYSGGALGTPAENLVLRRSTWYSGGALGTPAEHLVLWQGTRYCGGALYKTAKPLRRRINIFDEAARISARCQVDKIFDRVGIHPYGEQLTGSQSLANSTPGIQPSIHVEPPTPEQHQQHTKPLPFAFQSSAASLGKDSASTVAPSKGLFDPFFINN
ncbi:hypothetical protein PCANC_16176 [Puccinia coronata f. sp. avenae]|uniref:Tet-like 2OG-Fe(II) oxygenase domain-containing protein n=1 Tax=Puccinia coronata f. sp. avenae TaxID=200324 RepID=A0A2N5SZ66_9BASI|nr:hypothetical protein PCANC_16176 [Puccinia coronata f. sp. avenae]